MARKNYIEEKEVFIYDTKVFKDKRGHIYDLKCYDGYAVATKSSYEPTDCPSVLAITYPTKRYVKARKELAKQVMEYRGLFDQPISAMTYGDIMMCLGKPTTPQELHIVYSLTSLGQVVYTAVNVNTNKSDGENWWNKYSTDSLTSHSNKPFDEIENATAEEICKAFERSMRRVEYPGRKIVFTPIYNYY